MLVGIYILLVGILVMLGFVIHSLRTLILAQECLAIDVLEAIQDVDNNQAMLLRRLAETHPATDHPQPPAQPQSIQVFKGP